MRRLWVLTLVTLCIALPACSKSLQLHVAAQKGHKDIVERLLAQGADVNAKNRDGVTPLHMVAHAGHKDVVEILLAQGANVNAEDIDALTPLDYARKQGKSEVATLLSQHGGKSGKFLKTR